jgi:hypothetical protein
MSVMGNNRAKNSPVYFSVGIILLSGSIKGLLVFVKCKKNKAVSVSPIHLVIYVLLKKYLFI